MAKIIKPLNDTQIKLAKPKENDLNGLDCYAGLDLSSTSDITSVCYSFPFETEVRLLTRHYIP
jgi:phage terminase large subunit-like protein